MIKDFIEILERQELLQKIEDAGFKQIIDTLLLNENKVYTKKSSMLNYKKNIIPIEKLTTAEII